MAVDQAELSFASMLVDHLVAHVPAPQLDVIRYLVDAVAADDPDLVRVVKSRLGAEDAPDHLRGLRDVHLEALAGASERN